MVINIIYIDNTTKDVIDEIIEKIGSLAILDVVQHSTGLYLLKLDLQVITISCNSDEFLITRFELNEIRTCWIDSFKFGKVIIA